MDKPFFEQESVLAAVQGGELSGYHSAGGHLYVHVRLGATGWTYVVEIED